MAKVKTATTGTRSDSEIPKLAKKATRAAFNRAIKKGNVLVYADGELRKVGADGKITVIRKLETRTKVSIGAKFALSPNVPNAARATNKTKLGVNASVVKVAGKSPAKIKP
jgi:hypothetical protein